ncbi:MAG: FAD-dependent oxidoreductase [Pseudomonadota bacterium]
MTDLRPRTTLQCDVLVAGGGATGLAAAVTAARNGLNVVLVERYGFCGGGAVAGLSGTICGLYEASNDETRRPVKVVHGFVDDFIAEMERRDGLGSAIRYGKTYTRVHDPIVWREAADSLLTAAGVTILYHARVVGVLSEGGERIEGVHVDTKQGPFTIRAALTIDATGDCDLTAMAGLETFVGDDGHVQNPTMIFRLGGVDVARFMAHYGPDTIMPLSVSALIREANESGRYHLPRAKIWLFPTPQPGQLLCNCTRVLGPDGRELNTLIQQDFTDAEIQGRLQMRDYAAFFKERLEGCENSFVVDTGVQVGVRQTRQGRGRATLLNADILSARKFSNGIARSPWPIELHTGEKPRVEWIIEDFYEVPFETFVPNAAQGLLFGGRCLSAEHEAVASARVTAQCFSYGHALGMAARLAVQDAVPSVEIDGRDVRTLLNADGARLDG